MAVLSAILLGACIVVIAVQARTLLQLFVVETMYGRVFSLLDVSTAVITPIPVLGVGLLADKVSVLLTLTTFGFVTLFLVLLNSKFLKRRV